MKPPTDSAPTAGTRRTLLHGGGALNAQVYRVEAPDGRSWIEKDFSGKNLLVRATLGRFLIWRENWILRCLAKTGMVPGGVRKVSPVCLREDFCPGFALRDSLCGAYKGNLPETSPFHGVPESMLREPVPSSFFDELEAGVRRVHAAGFVHLDLHNARNIMVGPGFHPVLVDWQSAIPVFFLPRFIRRWLENIDLAGVYKFREKFRPGELGEAAQKVLHHSRKTRKFWLPRLRWGAKRMTEGQP